MKHSIHYFRRLSPSALIIATVLFFGSCDKLGDELGITTERIVEGLKKALNIGTDAASSALSATDGFYLDVAAKILLPEKAQELLAKKDNEIFNQLGITSKLDKEIENVIKSINRSAEDAASEIAPIFSSAITSLSITDGVDILNGIVPDTSSLKSDGSFDSTAATTFLQIKTFNSLIDVFAPKIDESLKKKIVANVSANDAWATLQNTYNSGVETYNKAIDYQEQVNNLTGGFDLGNLGFPKRQGLASGLPSLPTELANIDFLNLDLGEKMETLNVDLAEHCTSKALSAVFGKIKTKEKEIRKDPYAFADNLIQDVFGSVFKEQEQ